VLALALEALPGANRVARYWARALGAVCCLLSVITLQSLFYLPGLRSLAQPFRLFGYHARPASLGYFIASTMRLKTKDKQELLAEVDLSQRFRRLTALMNRELEVLELGSKIQDQVQSEMDKSQREYVLRQQLKAIQEELGETDETQAEVNELRDRIDEAALPEEVDKQARRELDRLAKLPTAAAEYGVIRTYIDWILSLPWSVFTTDNLDIPHARKVLDEDHYDLDDVKDRILEFLAVQKLREDVSGRSSASPARPAWARPVWARASARAMGRRFIRISVGGVRDESRSAGIAARTWAPCPAPSSAPSATRVAATPCS